ncbi:sensor histidine kinase N-terminal domain-containing protein [Rhizobacter sp. J219]|uniref:ATP-binding protein n=1 Tax=Rhizobacter sp. J219 TaxID=2898430 RepID=UPI002151EE24|nr:ATP-binding protein [Rhizobacter sp. J219]MCR5886016.1 sensor histidine kinase N-terminal domain-containing protein [Rhizobacter sp. J219]
MTLQRRLLVYVLVCAPLVWAVAFAVSFDRARSEVDELFDTQLMRMVRQVHALLPPDGDATRISFAALPTAPDAGTADSGAADLRDLTIAVWDRSGRRVLDRDGIAMPYRPGHSGFVDETIGPDAWRVYYLPAGEWLVAAGQRHHERDELVIDVTLSQLLPWLLMLPVLVLALAWAVRRALAPMQGLVRQLSRRDADDLTPIGSNGQPGELQPLLAAMNGLFARVADVLARERRFTGDAAHELRTPLAALRAQWDVVRRAAPGPARAQAEARLAAGLDRMDRLVAQLLMLSRVESLRSAGVPAADEVNWRAVVEEAVVDCLPLAERRHVEISCDWPADETHALPMLGSTALLTVMLRNLLDNAVRYATPHTTVKMTIAEMALSIENASTALAPDHLARLGERFHRPEGQAEPGSGLGISIAQRIATLHGLTLSFGPKADGTGFCATARFGTAAKPPTQG